MENISKEKSLFLGIELNIGVKDLKKRNDGALGHNDQESDGTINRRGFPGREREFAGNSDEFRRLLESENCGLWMLVFRMAHI